MVLLHKVSNNKNRITYIRCLPTMATILSAAHEMLILVLMAAYWYYFRDREVET